MGNNYPRPAERLWRGERSLCLWGKLTNIEKRFPPPAGITACRPPGKLRALPACGAPPGLPSGAGAKCGQFASGPAGGASRRRQQSFFNSWRLLRKKNNLQGG